MAKKAARKMIAKRVANEKKTKKAVRNSTNTPNTRNSSIAKHSQRRKVTQPDIDLARSSEQDAPRVRYSIETGIEQIENDQLTLADVPAKRASWKTIRCFAYSFDGHDHGHSSSKCGEIGNGLRKAYLANGSLSATLTNLRIGLFFEARRYHHFGTDPDSADMRYIRAVVDEIRKRLS